MTTRHDQSLQQSLAHDPGLKETVPSAEMQEELLNLPHADVGSERSGSVAFGPN